MASQAYSQTDANGDLTDVLSTELGDLYPELSNGIHRIEFLTSSENRTFRIVGSVSDYAMRVQRLGYHSEEEINAELAFVDILSRHGIAVAKPVTRKDGAFVSHLDLGEGVDQLVTIFHWVDGRHPVVADFREVYARMGSVMACMHRISQNITPAFLDLRPHWTYEEIVGSRAVWGDWDHPEYVDLAQKRLVHRFLEVFRKQLRSYDSQTQRGLIHADMRPTNILTKHGDVIIIDFDDCCHSWFLYDIAATVSFLEHHPALQEWVGLFLFHYQKARSLSKKELHLLPYFIGLRRVQLMAWYFSHQDSEYGRSLGIDWLYQSFPVLENILNHKLSFTD